MKNGVVQDKLWLPGPAEAEVPASTPASSARILSVRGEFGYWVFDGIDQTVPAPVLELPQGGRRRHHHRHVLPLALRDRQPVRRGAGGVAASAPPTSPERVDEQGKPYACTADDAAYATFELDERRDLPLQLVLVRARAPRRPADDAGRRHEGHRPWPACASAGSSPTPPRRKPVWNPDIPQPDRLLRRLAADAGQPRPTTTPSRSQWELFLRHVVLDTPFPWDLLEGAKGVQLAEAGTAIVARAPLDRHPGFNVGLPSFTTVTLSEAKGLVLQQRDSSLCSESQF